MTGTIKVDRIEKGAGASKITIASDVTFPSGKLTMGDSAATTFGVAIKTTSNSVKGNLTIDSGTNGLLIGPISVDSGVSITINGALTVI
jgi:hypothetical protein